MLRLPLKPHCVSGTTSGVMWVDSLLRRILAKILPAMERREIPLGKRKGYSTEMAISVLIDNICKATDNKEHVIGVFLDFAKAFDTVNHRILLGKLAHYGIRGNILQWIQNYLSNRQQRVKLKGTTSTLSNITCGVPEGSILGPLLFLIYINDLTTLSDKMLTIMFADDTSIFIQGNNIHEMEIAMNSEIKRLCIWL